MNVTNIICTHPDHVDGVSCEDRAVGCDSRCLCCMVVVVAEDEKSVLWSNGDLTAK